VSTSRMLKSYNPVVSINITGCAVSPLTQGLNYRSIYDLTRSSATA